MIPRTSPGTSPRSWFTLGCVSILCAAVHPPGAEAARPPNVIVIFTDDQGSVDMGAYGSKDLQTPAMDALAARGVRFTQFYAAAPVCSPSRAGLMTGLHPVRAGLPGNASSQKDGRGMPTEQVTMAEMFRAAGYATGHFGKWHLGYTPEEMPNGQGFDYSFGHMGGCIDNYSHFFYWQGPNRHDLYRNGREVQLPGQFFPDLLVTEADRFMQEHRERPFFLYVAFNMPHYPYQGDPKWLEHYRDLPSPRNLYCAFVSTLDERIGRLLETVRRLGLAEDTIVVFQSDHGHSTEERAFFGGGSAGPYRGAKFSLFEGGLRIPAIISWPGRLPQGEVRAQLAHGCDWLPTLAELTGAKLLNPAIDGKSLVPVITSGGAPSPHAVVHWQTGRGRSAQWAVREGNWKLIGNVRDTGDGPLSDDDKRLFLANLETDIGEKRNFSADQPAVLRRLLALRQDWAAQYDAP
jgi:arylsulfatase A-like enzyme